MRNKKNDKKDEIRFAPAALLFIFIFVLSFALNLRSAIVFETKQKQLASVSDAKKTDCEGEALSSHSIKGVDVCHKGDAAKLSTNCPGIGDAYAYLKTRLCSGKPDEYITGLNANFACKLAQFIKQGDSVGRHIMILSGYRNPQKQASLFKDAVRRHGSVRAARKWVAPPPGWYGSKGSNHNKGCAADIKVFGCAKNPPRGGWEHRNAHSFSLYFRMSHEPWHIEPLNKSWCKPGNGKGVYDLDSLSQVPQGTNLPYQGGGFNTPDEQPLGPQNINNGSGWPDATPNDMQSDYYGYNNGAGLTESEADYTLQEEELYVEPDDFNQSATYDEEISGEYSDIDGEYPVYGNGEESDTVVEAGIQEHNMQNDTGKTDDNGGDTRRITDSPLLQYVLFGDDSSADSNFTRTIGGVNSVGGIFNIFNKNSGKVVNSDTGKNIYSNSGVSEIIFTPKNADINQNIYIYNKGQTGTTNSAPYNPGLKNSATSKSEDRRKSGSFFKTWVSSSIGIGLGVLAPGSWLAI